LVGTMPGAKIEFLLVMRRVEELNAIASARTLEAHIQVILDRLDERS